jgi:hypothetical protein
MTIATMPPKPLTQSHPKLQETMKALVYRGPGKMALEDHPKPEIVAPTDAIVRITKTTICGTDLHILKGDVPTCEPGRILGHEGVGIIDKIGVGVTSFQTGRPSPYLMHQHLRKMRVLPQADVLSLYDRRLDSRQQDRRDRIASAAGLGSLMPASPVALGIFIHMTIAFVLGIALTFAWRIVRPHFSANASLFSFMLASLAGVWAVNFFLVLPAVSPAFIDLLPYPVSLASKLLFGVAAAAVLHLSNAEVANARSVQIIGSPKKILASAAV